MPSMQPIPTSTTGILPPSSGPYVSQKSNASADTGMMDGMVKFVKQLEEQKKLLICGLQSVTSAKLWFEKSLDFVNEKQNQMNVRTTEDGDSGIKRSTSSENICSKGGPLDNLTVDSINEMEKRMTSLIDTSIKLENFLKSSKIWEKPKVDHKSIQTNNFTEDTQKCIETKKKNDKDSSINGSNQLPKKVIAEELPSPSFTDDDLTKNEPENTDLAENSKKIEQFTESTLKKENNGGNIIPPQLVEVSKKILESHDSTSENEKIVHVQKEDKGETIYKEPNDVEYKKDQKSDNKDYEEEYEDDFESDDSSKSSNESSNGGDNESVATDAGIEKLENTSTNDISKKSCLAPVPSTGQSNKEKRTVCFRTTLEDFCYFDKDDSPSETCKGYYVG
uniref:uncharacterized protein LOC120331788 n=1 Tax=Styela clava TaxID=7725 RepID=UPI0019398CA3|nr:uncharacterized protein LOC120331788 [Styela clava]